jgi:hypothetical protein
VTDGQNASVRGWEISTRGSRQPEARRSQRGCSETGICAGNISINSLPSALEAALFCLPGCCDALPSSGMQVRCTSGVDMT